MCKTKGHFPEFTSLCCCCSVAKLCSALWLHGLQHVGLPCLSLSQTLLRFMSIESMVLFNHLILCLPLLLCLQSFPAFSSESALLIRWPKYWRFSFSISPSDEYSGLISFRIDWFGLLTVQGTLKSLLQHHSLKASILWCTALFMIQLFYSFHISGIIKYVFCKWFLSLSRMFPGSCMRDMDQHFIFSPSTK